MVCRSFVAAALLLVAQAATPSQPQPLETRSDTNYIVLGMILEQITGTKAYDEVRRRFLEPLKLRRVVPRRPLRMLDDLAAMVIP